MTLAEIAKEAKEGDRFGRPGITDATFDNEGLLIGHYDEDDDRDDWLLMKRQDILANDWKFTHRANLCPHCGKVIDEP